MVTERCPVCKKKGLIDGAECPHCGFSMRGFVESDSEKTTRDNSEEFLTKDDYEFQEKYRCHKKKLIVRSITFVIVMIALTVLFLKAGMGILMSPLIASLLASILALLVGVAFGRVARQLFTVLHEVMENIVDATMIAGWVVGLILFFICLMVVSLIVGLLASPIITFIDILLKISAGWRDIAYAILFFTPHALFIVSTILDIRFLKVNKQKLYD